MSEPTDPADGSERHVEPQTEFARIWAQEGWPAQQDAHPSLPLVAAEWDGSLAPLPKWRGMSDYRRLPDGTWTETHWTFAPNSKPVRCAAPEENR